MWGPLAVYLIGFYLLPIPDPELTDFLLFTALLLGALLMAFKKVHSLLLLSIFLFLGFFRSELGEQDKKEGDPGQGMAIVQLRELAEHWPDRGSKCVVSCWTEEGQAGRILLYLSGADADSVDPRRFYALADLQLRPLPYSVHPGTFNYGRYLEGKGIQYVAYADGEELIPLRESRSVHSQILGYRWRLLGSLSRALDDPKVKQILPALLLGRRSALSASVKEDFKKAGIVHILAVSGLHIGLVYGFMAFCLAPFSLPVWLRRAVLLLVIWAFVVCTGASVSVIRAAVMMSAWILSRNSARGLLVTVHLLMGMLFWRPDWLLDMGFQMSALAVLGILSLGRRSAGGRLPLLERIRSALMVSGIAQWFVLPILLLVFRSLPLYSLIANLFLLPVVSLLMPLGFLHWALSTVGLWQGPTAWALAKGTSFLMGTAEMIGSWPNSVLEIPLLAFEVQITFLLLWILLTLYWLRILRPPVSLLFALSILAVGLHIRDQRQMRTTVHALDSELLVSQRSGWKMMVYGARPIKNDRWKKIVPFGYSSDFRVDELLAVGDRLVLIDPNNEWESVHSSWRLTRVNGVPLLIDRDQRDTLDLLSSSVSLR